MRKINVDDIHDDIVDEAKAQTAENPRNFVYNTHNDDYVEIECRHLFDAVNKSGGKQHLVLLLLILLLHALVMQFCTTSFLFSEKSNDVFAVEPKLRIKRFVRNYQGFIPFDQICGVCRICENFSIVSVLIRIIIIIIAIIMPVINLFELDVCTAIFSGLSLTLTKDTAKEHYFCQLNLRLRWKESKCDNAFQI